MDNTALLVIDMLNDFVKDGGALFVPGAIEIVDNIKDKVNLVLGGGENNHVVFVCDAHDEDDAEFKNWPVHCVKGTWGAQVIDDLYDLETMTICEKTRYSGFYDGRMPDGFSTLADFLFENDIDRLMLCGVCTDICVLSTALDGLQHGFSVQILEDCCKTFSENNHNMVVELVNVMLQPLFFQQK